MSHTGALGELFGYYDIFSLIRCHKHKNSKSVLKENSGVFQRKPYFLVLWAVKFCKIHLFLKMSSVWNIVFSRSDTLMYFGFDKSQNTVHVCVFGQ